MRVEHVLLITTGLDAPTPHGIARLEELIRRSLAANLNPILVIGPAGDEILLGCRAAEDCDLVFDPNYAGDLFSSVKAGLMANHAPAYVVPLDQPLLDWEKWPLLESMLNAGPTAHAADVLWLESSADGKPAFPQLVTLNGVKRIKSLPAEAHWAETPSLRFECLGEPLRDRPDDTAI